MLFLKKILYLVNADWAFMVNRLPIALKAIELGYDVHIGCAFTGQQDELRKHGLKVHEVSFTRSGKNPFVELSTLISIFKLINIIKPDLVHSVTIKPVLYGGIISRLTRVPAFVAAVAGLGFIFSSESLKAKILKTLVSMKYKLALGHKNIKIIFQNPHDKSVLRKITGILDQNVEMIKGSGANLDQYCYTEEPKSVPVVAMACRLLREKGVFEFVEAARLVRNSGRDCKFLLIGSPDLGNPHSITEQELSEIKREGIVELLGHRTDISDIFSKSHIITLPSYYGEGLPKVLIEAAACGRPSITTDNPGCSEAVVDGYTGFIIPAKNSFALAESIIKLLDDPELRKYLGVNAREHAVKEFDIRYVVDRHIAIYKTLTDVDAVL